MVEIRTNGNKTEVLINGRKVEDVVETKLEWKDGYIPRVTIVKNAEQMKVRAVNCCLDLKENAKEDAPTQAEKCTHQFTDFIIELLADSFDQPCTICTAGIQIDEWMIAHESDWCEENCSKVSSFDCWKKFLESYYSWLKE